MVIILEDEFAVNPCSTGRARISMELDDYEELEQSVGRQIKISVHFQHAEPLGKPQMTFCQSGL